MDELIRIIWEHLESDDGPDLRGLTSDESLEVAQSIAEAIVASGWPRTDE